MLGSGSYTGRSLIVERECDAILIPHGYVITLIPGSAVRVTQSLGDNLTVEIQGNLVLVMGEDRDALGLDIIDDRLDEVLNNVGKSLEEKCWHQMGKCYDPEIPVNITELGLVYQAQVLEFIDADGARKNKAHVVMTLTSPTCGMGPVIIEEVKCKLKKIDGIDDVDIEIVFEPPWSQDQMTDAAKLQLGLM